MDAEYAIVLTMLKHNGLQLHSFSNEESAHIRLVIRGLDVASNPDEVVDELCELGYLINEAIRLHMISSPRHLLPLIRITLRKGVKVTRWLDLDSFCGI